MSKTLITSEHPKGRQIIDLARAALNKGKLDEKEAQRLIEQGGEFQAGLRELFTKFSRSNQYASEVVASSFTYPSEYKGPKPLSKQIDLLVEAFGLSLGGTAEFVEKVLPKLTLPDGAEGWFAIPSIEAVAKRHFPEIKNPAERYCRAVELIIEKLKGTRTVYNYRDGQLTTQYLRQHPRTIHAFDQILEQQKGDILVVAAQFGMGHRGESVRRARELFKASEFGLGGFAVGCMAFIHPERFVRYEQLHTDCAGDEYDFEAEGKWDRAPIWDFDGGRLGFDAGRVDYPYGSYGSVSGFLPEC